MSLIKQVFNFDIKTIDWNIYWSDYVLGLRQYIFKEDPKSLSKYKRKLKYIYLRDNLLLLILAILIIMFIIILFYQSYPGLFLTNF